MKFRVEILSRHRSDLTEKKDSRWYNLTLKPTAEDFEKGEVIAPPDDVVPVPGRD